MRSLLLLRSVNLGSHHKVPMKTWAARLRELGCAEVTTYLQSGNAVVEHDGPLPGGVVERDLRAGFGVSTAVLSRTPEQVRAVRDGCPWPEHASAEPTQVHAVFVDGPVTRPWWREQPERYAPERAEDGPDAYYLLLPNGAGRPRMPAERGARATARNWRTVLALSALLERERPPA